MLGEELEVHSNQSDTKSESGEQPSGALQDLINHSNVVVNDQQAAEVSPEKALKLQLSQIVSNNEATISQRLENLEALENEQKNLSNPLKLIYKQAKKNLEYLAAQAEATGIEKKLTEMSGKVIDLVSSAASTVAQLPSAILASSSSNEAQLSAPVPVAPLDKYEITRDLAGVPESKRVNQALHVFGDNFALKMTRRETQAFQINPDSLAAAEDILLTLQEDVMNHFFDKIKDLKMDANTYHQNYVMKSIEMLEYVHLRVPTDPSATLYRLYTDARVLVHMRYIRAEELVENAKKVKKVSDSMITLFEKAIGKNKDKQKSNTRDIAQLAEIYNDNTNKSSGEMIDNIASREAMSMHNRVLAEANRIYQMLADNRLISYEEYRFLVKHRHETKLLPDSQQELLEIAKLMVTLEPGYDEIDKNINAALNAFTVKSLTRFVDVLGVQMRALAESMNQHNFSDSQKMYILKLNLYIISCLVPSLPFVSLKHSSDDVNEKIRYNRLDYFTQDIFNGFYNGVEPFAIVSAKYNEALDACRKTCDGILNALVDKLNELIKEFIEEPDAQKAKYIIEKMNEYDGFMQDYLQVVGGAHFDKLHKFAVDDLRCDNVNDTLLAMFSKFEKVMVSSISTNHYGAEDSEVTKASWRFKFLRDALKNLDNNTKCINETQRSVKRIGQLIDARRMIAIRKLGLIKRVEMASHATRLLKFNRRVQNTIAQVLEISCEAQDRLICTLIDRMASNRSLEAGVNLMDDLKNIIQEEKCERVLGVLYQWVFAYPKAEILDLPALLPAITDVTRFSQEQIEAIKLILRHKPRIHTIIFGHFRPTQSFLRQLVQHHENIHTYLFDCEMEKLPELTGPITLTLQKRESDKEYFIYERQRAPIDLKELKHEPSMQASTSESEGSPSSGKVNVKQRLRNLIDRRRLKKTKEGASSSSSSSPAQTAVSSVDNTEIISHNYRATLYNHMLENNMDPRAAFMQSTEVGFELGDFQQAMSQLFPQYALGEKFASDMVQVTAELLNDRLKTSNKTSETSDDNVNLIVEGLKSWIKAIQEGSPRYFNVLGDFLLRINIKYFTEYLEEIRHFSNLSAIYYAELTPDDFEVIIQKLMDAKLAKQQRKDFVKLLNAYLQSVNLLDNYANIAVLERYYAFVDKLLKNEDTAGNAILLLRDQFVFSTDLSIKKIQKTLEGKNDEAIARLEKLQPIIKRVNENLLKSLVVDFSFSITKSLTLEQTRNYLSLIMNNPVAGTDDVFIRLLAYYIENHADDLSFARQMTQYTNYIESRNLQVTPERGLLLFPSIISLSRLKLKATQKQIAQLIKNHAKADEIKDITPDVVLATKPLGDAFGQIRYLARLHNCLDILHALPQDQEEGDFIVIERQVSTDNIVSQKLNMLNKPAQDIYQYFLNKTSRLSKQATKLTIIIKLIDELKALPDGQATRNAYITALTGLQALQSTWQFETPMIMQHISALNQVKPVTTKDQLDIFKSLLVTRFDHIMDSLVAQYCESVRREVANYGQDVGKYNQMAAEIDMFMELMNGIATIDPRLENRATKLLTAARDPQNQISRDLLMSITKDLIDNTSTVKAEYLRGLLEVSKKAVLAQRPVVVQSQTQRSFFKNPFSSMK